MDVLSLFYCLLGIVMGAIISYFITRYYYKKSSVTEKDVIGLFYSLERIYLNNKYPNIFNSPESYRREYTKDKLQNDDTPFVLNLCTQSNLVKKGTKSLVLFRVQDLGRNFYSNGVNIVNGLNNYNIPFVEEGFGWCSFYIEVPEDAPLGNQTVLIKLVDTRGNESSTTFEYFII